MHGDMMYRTLGHTGERVSAIGLGGWHLALPKVDAVLAHRIIRTAIDRGITFMDNSWDYNEGESERRMGAALRDGYRDRVFLMTKIDGRSHAEATLQLDESLRRLQTDRIDLVQHHEVIRFDDPHRIFDEEGANRACWTPARPASCATSASPATRTRTSTCTRSTWRARSTLPIRRGADAAERDGRPLPQLRAARAAPPGRGRHRRSRHEAAGQWDHPEVPNTVSAPDCLRYALHLPVSVVITGIDSMEVLDQACEVAGSFTPLSERRCSGPAGHHRATAAGGSSSLSRRPPLLMRPPRTPSGSVRNPSG